MTERVKLVIDIDSITYLDCLTDVQENIPCSTLEKAVADGKFVLSSEWIPCNEIEYYCCKCSYNTEVDSRYCPCCGARMVNTSFGTKPVDVQYKGVEDADSD